MPYVASVGSNKSLISKPTDGDIGDSKEAKGCWLCLKGNNSVAVCVDFFGHPLPSLQAKSLSTSLFPSQTNSTCSESAASIFHRLSAAE